MVTKPGTVYIVHHIDTEGPLHEPLTETFKRVENTLGIRISLPRTKSSLKKLQEGLGVKASPEVISKIKMMLNPHLVNFNETWGEIEKMLRKIMSKSYRNVLRDSFDGGWVYNWHVMDHVGFVTNERGRDLGHHRIFDRYKKIIKETESVNDRIHWHFHPIPFFREAHIPATSYENSYTEIHQILCKRLIDKQWFPCVNRAGFHTERPDSNWFLEQWIPFDPSNQSIPNETKEVQKDAINGRFGDWKGAPSNWDTYHPDIYDWRKEGDSKRVIARVLNLRSRFRNIDSSELEGAFTKAQKGSDVYVGITNHDWRDMVPEIDDFRAILVKVAHKFPNTKYKFSESVQAFREVLGYSKKKTEKEKINFNLKIIGNVLKVDVTNGELFGPQPYLAIKTNDRKYFHDNFDFGKFGKEYFYTFDRYTVPLNEIETISVASNDKYGSTCIKNINL